MNYNVLACIMVVAYLLFAAGSQHEAPLAAGSQDGGRLLVKRAQPGEVHRAVPARRG